MTNQAQAVQETNLANLKLLHRGKVRDVYEVDEKRLLIVATDRLSAFDSVLATPIPRKGEILTQISKFWFSKLEKIGIAHHLITAEIDEMPENVRQNADVLARRSMLVKRTEVFPIECVVRGYLAGSGWKDYRQNGVICGHKLPPQMPEAAKLPETIFTPATKAAEGHDENISEEKAAEIIGAENFAELKQKSLQIYNFASNYAAERGIILADTKFEFGRDENGEILLIDEVLTPDSSRFWAREDYREGTSPSSFDKQFVRDYLETTDWNKLPPAPALPNEIAEKTSAKYLEAFRILTEKNIV